MRRAWEPSKGTGRRRLEPPRAGNPLRVAGCRFRPGAERTFRPHSRTISYATYGKNNLDCDYPAYAPYQTSALRDSPTLYSMLRALESGRFIARKNCQGPFGES